VFGEVGSDEFVSVRRRLQCDPDQRNLGAAVGIEGDQRGVGTLSNEVTCGVVEFYTDVLPLRVAIHSRIYDGVALSTLQ
jgi:hypothetical protein